jgi:hypothetical protein
MIIKLMTWGEIPERSGACMITSILRIRLITISKRELYKGLLIFLGGNQSSPQEKTRLHPTPTGPGRCPAAPIYNISFTITYYGVGLPVITCSQHTQYFL